MFQDTHSAAAVAPTPFKRRIKRSTATDIELAEGACVGTQLSSLDNALMHDLLRFDRSGEPGAGLEVLEVMAAALRHTRRLRVMLERESRPVTLTVFPRHRQVHCALPMGQLLESHLSHLRVVLVEPAQIPSPEESGHASLAQYAPLGPLVWALAMRGSRVELLPEIAGTAAYRISPGTDLSALTCTEALASAVSRLQRQTTSIQDIASWPGMDHKRASRLLNGLYLHAALMVSRAHPAATNEGWRHPPN